MKNQNGKVTITIIILLLVLGYGVFCAVQLLRAGFTVSHIENEIRRTLFVRQGSDFSPIKSEEIIKDILEKNGVRFDPDDKELIDVLINPDTFKISYYAEFEIDMNFLFFQKTRFVVLDKIVN
ncbi:MAG: hypothetical protein KAW12_05040 [Candidatus Aminicenantes bacterium]|nr:hypothetical protein [Candidatus Aminicenantes bacterium]